MSSPQRFAGLMVALVVVVLLAAGWPSPRTEVRPPDRAPAPQVAPDHGQDGGGVHPGGQNIGPMIDPPEYTLEDGRWSFAAYGLSAPTIDGWTPVQHRWRAYLVRDMEHIGRGAINVLGLPNPFGDDLTALFEESRRSIDAAPYLELDSLERGRLGEREVVHVAYHGTVEEGGHEIRLRGLIYLDGRQQVILTANAWQEHWAELEPVFTEFFEGLELAPPARPTHEPETTPLTGDAPPADALEDR